MVAFGSSSSRFYAQAASRIVNGSDTVGSRFAKVVSPRDRRLLLKVLQKTRAQPGAGASDMLLFAHALEADPRSAAITVNVVDRVAHALLDGAGADADADVGTGADPVDLPTPAAPAQGEQPPQRGEQRWLNVEFEDQPAGAGFAVNEWYTVAVDFSALRRRTALASSAVSVFPPGVDVVEFSLQVTGTNAEVEEGMRRLRVRRDEKRPQIVRFDFRPEADGPCTLRIVLRRRRNFCLAVTIDFEAGTESTEPTVVFDGRPVAAAFAAPARSVSLHLTKVGDTLLCSALGPDAAHPSAVLPLAPSGVADATSAIYVQLDTLAKTIDLDAIPLRGETVTPLLDLDPVELGEQRRATIEASKEALGVHGRNLVRRLFFSDPLNRAAVDLGTWLLDILNQEDPLEFQIVSDAGISIPWGLLYTGPAIDDADDVDWRYFAGVRHIVEQLAPSTYRGAPPAVPTEPAVAMAFSGYAAKGGEAVTDAVARQRRYFEGLAGANERFSFTSSEGRAGALDTLRDPAPPAIVYFFCHGSTASADAIGGLGAMSLTFAPGAKGVLKLERLAAADATPGQVWSTTPFIVLNACQVGRQAQNDTFDFVTVLLQRNARGVVASHAYIPATFGDSWAQSFFEQLFAGEPVGTTLRTLTLHSLAVYGVPLGLLYTSICDADTRLEPSLL